MELSLQEKADESAYWKCYFEVCWTTENAIKVYEILDTLWRSSRATLFQHS